MHYCVTAISVAFLQCYVNMCQLTLNLYLLLEALCRHIICLENTQTVKNIPLDETEISLYRLVDFGF